MYSQIDERQVIEYLNKHGRSERASNLVDRLAQHYQVDEPSVRSAIQSALDDGLVVLGEQMKISISHHLEPA